MAKFVAVVPLNLVAMEWMTVDGDVLTEVNDRVQASQICQISDKTFACDVTVNPLRFEDRGVYSCEAAVVGDCLLYTSPSPRDATLSRMPSSA